MHTDNADNHKYKLIYLSSLHYTINTWLKVISVVLDHQKYIGGSKLKR